MQIQHTSSIVTYEGSHSVIKIRTRFNQSKMAKTEQLFSAIISLCTAVFGTLASVKVHHPTSISKNCQMISVVMEIMLTVC